MLDLLRFFPSRLPFILSALLVISLSIELLPFASAHAKIIKIYAGAGQMDPDPIAPCITSGFNVDASMTYTLNSAAVTRFHRIDREGTGSKVGFIVTTDSVNNERYLITYDGRAMTQIAARRIELASNLDYVGTQLQGEVVNGTLFLIRLVNNGRLGCAAAAGFPCASLSKWDFNGYLLGETVVGSIGIGSLDDARLNGASTLILSYANPTDRALMTFSIPGGSFIADSGTIVAGANGEFALNGDTGFQYIGYKDASKTVKKIALDSVTILSTSNFSLANLNILGSLLAIPPNVTLSIPGYIIAHSTSVAGTVANENFRNYTSLADIGTLTPYILADASANPRSTFWDITNLRTYSWRSTGQILRLPLATQTVEQRFTCPAAGCAVSAAPTTDFILRSGRLYNAADTGAGIGTITRIQVCSVGGPPA